MAHLKLNNYTPRIPQKKVIHAVRNGARYIYMLLHRQIGKTEFIYKVSESKLLSIKTHFPEVAISATTIKQCRRLYDARFKKHLRKMTDWKYDSDKAQYTFTRTFMKDYDTATIDVYGSDGQRSSDRGGTYDVASLDEYGASYPNYGLGVVGPMLDAKKGPLFVTGTPLGPNHFKDEFEYVEREMLKGNPLFYAIRWTLLDSLKHGLKTQEEVEAIESRYPPSKRFVYEAEYLLDWYAYALGQIFSVQLGQAEANGRVGNFPMVPGIPVNTFWDLGRNGTAVWFVQRVNGFMRCVKYVEGLERVHLQSFIKKEIYPLIEEGWQFHTFYWPHDIAFGESMSKHTRYATVRKLLPNFKHIILKRITNVKDTVDVSRQKFTSFVFDQFNCGEGLSRLRQYKWSKNLKEVDKLDPSSHGGDAFLLIANSPNLTKGGEKKEFMHSVDEDFEPPGNYVIDTFVRKKRTKKNRGVGWYDIE